MVEEERERDVKDASEEAQAPAEPRVLRLKGNEKPAGVRQRVEALLLDFEEETGRRAATLMVSERMLLRMKRLMGSGDGEAAGVTRLDKGWELCGVRVAMGNYAEDGQVVEVKE